MEIEEASKQRAGCVGFVVYRSFNLPFLWPWFHLCGGDCVFTPTPLCREADWRHVGPQHDLCNSQQVPGHTHRRTHGQFWFCNSILRDSGYCGLLLP